MDEASAQSVHNNSPIQGQNNISAELVHITQNFNSPPPLNSDTLATSVSHFNLIWNVPLRNSYFTGREEFLDHLHKQLHTTQTTAITQAISGLGGIGKTQIAIEYAYRYREEYHYIFWVQAENQESLTSSYLEIAHLLNLPQKDAPEQQLIVNAVKHWLQNQSKWLLIFDNVEDLKLLPLFLPAAPQGHYLYTTRASTFGNLAHTLTLESFNEEHGTLFLLRRAKILEVSAPLDQALPEKRKLALEITQTLGGLPLALDQAGAYIEEMQIGLAEYLPLYQQRQTELLNTRGDSALDHPASVVATWSLSFEQVEKHHPASAQLLHFLAFLAPDDIPEALVMQGATYLGGILTSAASDLFLLNKTIKPLLSFSLIKRDPEKKTFSIHRLVQTVLCETIPLMEHQQWIDLTIKAMEAIYPPITFEHWGMCERYLPHALLCLKWIEQKDIVSAEAARLLQQIGYYLYKRAYYREAESLLQRSLLTFEGLTVPNYAGISECLNILGLLYTDQGKYKEAELSYQKSMNISEQYLEPKHINIVVIKNNLAISYRCQGKLKEAEPLYREALRICEQQLGPKDTFTATVLNNLGYLCTESGSHKEAEILLKQSLTILERVLGPEHPEKAQSLNNLALLYIKLGNLNEAEALHKKALKIRETSLGSKHPDTATSINNLGYVYEKQGNYELAEKLYKSALEIRKQVLGLEHPFTIGCLNNLAHLYFQQEKYEEAKEFLIQALKLTEKTLGVNHLDTITAMFNLGSVYIQQKKYLDAQPLLEKAFTYSETQLGYQHPLTDNCLTSLTHAHEQLWKFFEAKLLYKQSGSNNDRQLQSLQHLIIPNEQSGDITLLSLKISNITNNHAMIPVVDTKPPLVPKKLRGKQKKKARQRQGRSQNRNRLY